MLSSRGFPVNVLVKSPSFADDPWVFLLGTPHFPQFFPDKWLLHWQAAFLLNEAREEGVLNEFGQLAPSRI